MSNHRLSIVLLAILSIFATEALGQREYRYMIYLTDKGDNVQTMTNPEAYLSERSLARRARQDIGIDSLDIPVCCDYTAQITRHGRVIGKSKWLNAVMVGTSGNDAVIDSIRRFDFVQGIDYVGYYDPEEASGNAIDGEVVGKTYDTVYGASLTALETNSITDLHEKGFTGEGIMIAMTDDGYCNADVLQAGWQDKIVCTKDFVNNDDDMTLAIGSHGITTFSCIASDIDYKIKGSAPGAEFALLRTEYLPAEQPAEEYYWVFAAEFADSIGCDIINISLGYNTYDWEFESHTPDDLDASSAMSRCADIAVSRGMIVVCSAGNEGSNSWGYITIPADGKDVLAVGGLGADSNSQKASYSSHGPSADGRTKPDIMAPGTVYSISNRGNISSGSGTSFAAPIITGGVACLWQALPDATAKEIINLLRLTASKHDNPDNETGYGTADFLAAYESYISDVGLTETCHHTLRFADGHLIIPDGLSQADCDVRLYDLSGRLIWSARCNETGMTTLPRIPQGFYIVELISGNQSQRNILCYE